MKAGRNPTERKRPRESREGGKGERGEEGGRGRETREEGKNIRYTAQGSGLRSWTRFLSLRFRRKILNHSCLAGTLSLKTLEFC